ncbi:pyridoxine/pyridoxamine 5'-phosphate oxidase [Herbaspirillum sp. B65]|uniref:pyridoxine/pyridoxamine 5'-phosphate oxidase n=1 Tax=Herbaspirillum sp. B65 TaxID=137708 RepID=UPI00034DAA38|nr:pyridoxal 5'-phosphate synthase [Herbaspirillum sp. B65]
MNPLQIQLKSLDVLVGAQADFQPEQAPDEPHLLFLAWLQLALERGVPEPHIVTLSTVDEKGCPDARSVTLLNVDERGWHFAANANSPKGRQMGQQPLAALTFYWAGVARQVRIRGRIATLPAEVGAADYLARPDKSRAAILLGRQSMPLQSPEVMAAAIEQQLAQFSQTPGRIAASWTMYVLEPETVEFWHADKQRLFTRLRYARHAKAWRRELLWP